MRSLAFWRKEADPEAALLERLRRGDEDAFVELVERYQRPLLHLARGFVRDPAVAEDVVAETWQAVVRGLERFEGRASLRTWLFTIAANRARTRAVREARSVPFSQLAAGELAADEPAVDPSRFQGPNDPHPGGWSIGPTPWDELPEERLLAAETRGQVDAAIAALPPVQRTVITLRDVEGVGAAEVCNVLGLTETNQRVLLHRARTKVRRALERYLEES